MGNRLQEIKAKVAKYQKDFTEKVKKGTETKDYDLPKAYAFKKTDIEDILKQDGCTGIRVYFTEDKDKVTGKETINLVIVGTADNGNTNILPVENTTLSAALEAVMIDDGTPCPTNCPTNPL